MPLSYESVSGLLCVVESCVWVERAVCVCDYVVCVCFV